MSTANVEQRSDWIAGYKGQEHDMRATRGSSLGFNRWTTRDIRRRALATIQHSSKRRPAFSIAGNSRNPNGHCALAHERRRDSTEIIASRRKLTWKGIEFTERIT